MWVHQWPSHACLARHRSNVQIYFKRRGQALGLKTTKEGGTMKAVNSPAKPIAGTAQGVWVTLRMWIGKLDFSIVPMDDFKMVLGMELFNQVHAFFQPATNSLSVLDGSMAFMVPIRPIQDCGQDALSHVIQEWFSERPKIHGLYSGA